MKKSSLSGTILLLITAIIWGAAFVAQSSAMDSVGAFTYNCVRSLLGGTFLLPITILIDKKKKLIFTKPDDKGKIKKTFIVGTICGVILTVATSLQQLGMALGTSSGKAGFITALYILFVPVFGLFFFKKKISVKIWICVAISLVGLYLLCSPSGDGFALSDILVLLCAFVFTLHIIAIDNFASNLDGVKVSCIQFYVCGILSGVAMFIFETPDLASIKAASVSILYGGILSCGVAYTLQIVGQQRCEPTLASILMSLESAFAVISSIIFSAICGNLVLPTTFEWLGMGLMFFAIMLAQINFKGFKKVKQ